MWFLLTQMFKSVSHENPKFTWSYWKFTWSYWKFMSLNGSSYTLFTYCQIELMRHKLGLFAGFSFVEYSSFPKHMKERKSLVEFKTAINDFGNIDCN